MDDPSPRHSDDPSRMGELFVQLFAQSRDDIFAYIYSLLPRWSDAEDVFQQTSLVLWQKFGDFESGTDFRAWACTVALNHVRNFRRVAGRDRLQFDDVLLEQMAIERIQRPKSDGRMREYLSMCLAKLTPDQRTLLGLAYTAGKTIKRLAEDLHRSPQTIYNRLNQIRRMLFECLKAAVQQEGRKP